MWFFFSTEGNRRLLWRNVIFANSKSSQPKSICVSSCPRLGPRFRCTDDFFLFWFSTIPAQNEIIIVNFLLPSTSPHTFIRKKTCSEYIVNCQRYRTSWFWFHLFFFTKVKNVFFVFFPSSPIETRNIFSKGFFFFVRNGL